MSMMANPVERMARSRWFQQLRDGPPPLTFSLGIIRTYTSIFAAVVLLLISPGCTASDNGVFISLFDDDVRLELRDLERNYPPGNPKFYLLPRKGEEHVRYDGFQELTVLDSSGRVLFREVLMNLYPESRPYRKDLENKIYFLITPDGAFPIPVAWQKSWREHIPEITIGFDHEAARKKLGDAWGKK
jgi:hypothetical protein